MSKDDQGIIKPNERIKRILKIPTRNFFEIEYETGETRFIDERQ